MKIKTLLFLFLISAIAFGCKSSPRAKATPLAAESKPETAAGPTDANGRLLAGAQAARDSALAANADKTYPQAFAALDARLNEIKTEYNAGSTDAGLGGSLTDIALRFKALEQASLALQAKKRADELDFEPFAPDSYKKGKDALAGLADFEKGDAQALFDNASTAYSSFNDVLAAGFTASAEKARLAALESKARADSVKAAVAAKAAYADAASRLSLGDKKMEAKQPEAALADFLSAQASFEELYESVSARREAARKAIQDAENKAQEVEEYALQADGIAPLADAEAAEEAEQ
jgi:hypothetical protein